MPHEFQINDSIKVRGYSGVAFRFDGHPSRQVEKFIEDEDSCAQCLCKQENDEYDGHVHGYYEIDEVVNENKAQCHMVGDDHEFIVDINDCSPLSEDEFCSECGQIGCGH